MIKVHIIGRLTKEPELTTTSTGISVMTFDVASDRMYKNKFNNEKQTDFVTCVAWRQTAEYIQNYLRKGSLIYIEGRLETRHFMKQDGQKQKVYEIQVDSLQGLEKPKTNTLEEPPSPYDNSSFISSEMDPFEGD